MSARSTQQEAERRSHPLLLPFYPLAKVGEYSLRILDLTGSALLLLFDAIRWIFRAMCYRKVRIGRAAIVSQILRVGVSSIFIISLVSGSVGLILALQMAPPLAELGQSDKVANIVGVGIIRELGPLIASIVLTGFAGAAIAAEIGTMVVGEEVEALEAHALNPVRFLVVPRIIATVLSMGALAVVADIVAVGSALAISVLALDIPYPLFMENLLQQLKLVDFLTGVSKAFVFGLLIGVIACTNGLRVKGGAAGVGMATTGTVVQCVVSIVLADLVFTSIFYVLDLA